nr:hypothetical protein Iba_chr05cCG13000 [Ipomoea batatas]
MVWRNGLVVRASAPDRLVVRASAPDRLVVRASAPERSVVRASAHMLSLFLVLVLRWDLVFRMDWCSVGLGVLRASRPPVPPQLVENTSSSSRTVTDQSGATATTRILSRATPPLGIEPVISHYLGGPQLCCLTIKPLAIW